MIERHAVFAAIATSFRLNLREVPCIATNGGRCSQGQRDRIAEV
jgi:hypothetical protein